MARSFPPANEPIAPHRVDQAGSPTQWGDYQPEITETTLPIVLWAFRDRYRDRDVRYELISNVLRGDWEEVDPSNDKVESRSPNLIQVALEDTAEAAGQVPTIRVRPRKNTDKLIDVAARMEKIGTGYFEYSRMNLLIPRTVMDLAAYGLSAWVIWPNYDDRLPAIERRDPRTCYPEPGFRPGQKVRRCIFTRKVHYAQLPADYQVKLVNFINDDTGYALEERLKLTLVEFFSETEIVVAALFSTTDMNMSMGAQMGSGFPAGQVYVPVILDRIPNELGVCPVVIGSRITYDDEFRGQFDQVIGIQPAHVAGARLRRPGRVLRRLGQGPDWGDGLGRWRLHRAGPAGRHRPCAAGRVQPEHPAGPGQSGGLDPPRRPVAQAAPGRGGSGHRLGEVPGGDGRRDEHGHKDLPPDPGDHAGAGPAPVLHLRPALLPGREADRRRAAEPAVRPELRPPQAHRPEQPDPRGVRARARAGPGAERRAHDPVRREGLHLQGVRPGEHRGPAGRRAGAHPHRRRAGAGHDAGLPPAEDPVGRDQPVRPGGPGPGTGQGRGPDRAVPQVRRPADRPADPAGGGRTDRARPPAAGPGAPGRPAAWSRSGCCPRPWRPGWAARAGPAPGARPQPDDGPDGDSGGSLP